MRFPFRIKKAKRRLLSILIAMAIFADAFPVNVFSGIISSPLTIEASAAEYSPTKQAADFSGGTITFAAMSEFLDYCYHYAHTDGFASGHQNDTLIIALTTDTAEDRGIIPETFVGLGTEAYPFGGTIRFAGASVTLKAHRAIFSYVYDSVKLLDNAVTNEDSPVELKLVRLSNVGNNESKPLLADHVIHNHKTGSTSQWNIVLDSSSTGTYSGVIGELGAGAVVNLNFTNNSAAAIVSNSTDQSADDAGVICGVMNTGSVMNLSYSATVTNYSVSSASGNAGGLVGTMNGTATLNISSYPTVSHSVTATSGYAGGLVGELTSDATITMTASVSSTESLEALTTVSASDSLSEETIEASTESEEQVVEASSSEVTEELPAESSEVSEELSGESSVESSTDSSTEGTAESIVDPSDDSPSESLAVPLAAPSVNSSAPISVSGTVKGASGAGGLFGHYTNKISDAEFDLSGYQISTTVYGKYCGGVFGVLDNNMDSEQSPCVLTIKNNDNKGTVSVSSVSGDTTYDYSGYFGGIAGEYKTGALANSLVLDTLTVTVAANSGFNAFGGAIGIVNSAAYVKANKVTVNASGTDKRRDLKQGECDNYAFFGGLAGATSKNRGVLIDLGDFTLNASLNGSGNSKYGFLGGGVIGQFYNGVLRLSGITDMRNAIPDGGYQNQESNAIRQSFYAQLVGYNDNVLVYALGDGSTESASYGNGWRYLRSNGAVADDLGIWGQVVRVFKSGDTYVNAETAGILSFDGTEHTVKLEPAMTSMASSVDFAKTALNIMLNNGTGYNCLLFSGGNENTRATLLSSNDLSITAVIDLSGTGINGFMRDGVGISYINGTVASLNKTDSFGEIGTFTGKLNGNGQTISLAIGESYGVYSAGAAEGSGQIYRHQFNGLFSIIGDGNSGTGTVTNLTVAGNITLHNAGANGMNVGGIAARSHGNATLSGVTVSHSVNYFENSTPDRTYVTAELGKNVGGLIGYIDKNSDNGTINISGTTVIKPTFNFGGRYKNWLMYGGAIGSVASSKVQINIAQNQGDTCTVSMKAFVLEGTACENSSVSGGLIGYIHTNLPDNGSYSDKEVNIGNLVFDDCTVSGPSSATGGGLLGYSWYNTKVNINGLTVSDATLNYVNNAAEVGIMCYDATGMWTVDSMEIKKLSVNNGGSVSLGMIVNRAYKDSNGLYLNVLNSGYKLTDKNESGGITLPNTLGVYDEIAAFSATNVETGGAGVISINMNTGRDVEEAKVLSTGTYQNQLTSASSDALNTTDKYANPSTRYYYNLEKMKTSDPGQNLVLWSVNKYAAANIKGAFSSSVNNNTLTGAANLSGLSFYPIGSVDATYTINDLQLTFDYSSMYGAESSNKINDESDGNSDSYVRDPADKNQHYLMHSGLFIDLPAGKTITISGPFSIEGTFLEDASHQGVLICGTMSGKLTCTNDALIKLDGIKPMTRGNAGYTDGYLLINKIERNSDTIAPELLIKNLSTTEKYTKDGVTPTVAKSLIGAAHGRELKIEFSGIKLDARNGENTNESLNADDFYNAYKTYNSIFKEATLLASIDTDQSAVLLYNYTYADDWGSTDTDAPRNVTYGKEVTASSEYPGQEQQYYGVMRCFTNPIDNTERTTAYDFSQGFLPYVLAGYSSVKDDAGLYKRELKVNVMTEGLTVGCGTYNDPYVITDGEQLEAVASFIKNGTISSLSKIKLPTDYSSFDSLADNAKGDRWCTDKTNDGYHAVYEPNDAGTGYQSGALVWSKIENVQYYLANAYYLIRKDIELSDSFIGLGGTSANTAFRGVIVGEKKDDGTLYRITNKSTSPFIKVSNGCVVKDVNIVVANEAITLNQGSCGSNNAYFGYDSKCEYYGGIIGEIMGGDNIIDNSYISYNASTRILLKGTYGMLCPVGSYVGVVVFGGLIFRNMTIKTVNDNAKNLVVNYYADSITDGVNLVLESSKGAIYVNPLVGRVINGYAVNETTQFSVTENNKYHDDLTDRVGITHSLKNTKKHYTIADINKNEQNKLDVSSVPTSTTSDGTINIPNSQALFVLSLITQSLAGTANTSIGEYNNSLSYGTYGNNVYGMSRGADYDKIGTNDSAAFDYSTSVKIYDTAEKTAVPYIINRYTSNEIEQIDIYEQFTGEVQNLNGSECYIYNNLGTSDSDIRYLLDTKGNHNNCLGKTADKSSATIWYFESKSGSDNQYYLYSKADNDNTENYLKMTKADNSGNGKLEITKNKNEASIFTVTAQDNGKFAIGCVIESKTYYINQHTNTDSSNGFGGWYQANNGSKLILLVKKTVPRSLCPARCVTTSTDDTASGYYDITLKEGEFYQLPDSFRGLGAVGKNNLRYNLKVDVFDGKGCTIDEDIYFNRYSNANEWCDNYFDKLHSDTDQDYSNSNAAYFGKGTSDISAIKRNHGIGLFNSVFMRDENSCFRNFSLSGSVNIESYTLDTSSLGAECTLQKKDYLHWLSVGGVCGWSSYGYWCRFENITLSSLSVRGSTLAGGLLGHSGISCMGTGLSAPSMNIEIEECGAERLSVEITSSLNEKYRASVGGLVGKVIEGKVIIDGKEGKTVSFASFQSPNNDYIVSGGLVGYAGAGCEVKNMAVCSADETKPITIGNNQVAMSGGIVGLMQPPKDDQSNYCQAIFVKCEVSNINVSGIYAGGFYGGTHDSKWSPYSIKILDCKVVGVKGNNNHITAQTRAGGFVGDGYVSTKASEGTSNIEIANSTISNYTIKSNKGNNNFSGGFIGYTQCYDGAVVCFIHDSSVENCEIATNMEYGGGVIGRIESQTGNRILGYNVMLKDVTSPSSTMGAWVGSTPYDNNTAIQLTGMAIYGSGFEKNIGNWTVAQNSSSTNTSFVFADYDGECTESTLQNSTVSGLNYLGSTHVEMPSYPFVNINPQSKIGVFTSTDEQGITTTTEEIISGDGAVLLADTVADYSGFTSELTRAAQIFADTQLTDKNATNYSRRYTTFVNSTIYAENTIEHYLSRKLNDDGDRISTYKTEAGSLSDNVADFAVVVIANTNDTETTNLINRYIQLVTNTTTDYTTASDYYNIAVSSCEYSGGRFAVTEATPGLTWTPPSGSSSGSFALNGRYADSKKTNTFTLVDVQFKDPLHTDKIAYHLYVPVYTIKQIEVDFSVAVKTGTSSVSYSSGVPSTIYSANMGKDGTHIDSLQTWITQYIRFTYSEEDINVLLSSGNVKWNHEKSVIFDTQNFSDTEIRLPNNTYMVLVDPNGNSDRQYYAKASDFATYRNITNNKDGWKIDLTTFKRGEDDYFSVKPLAELIDPYLVVTDNQGKGSYADGTVDNYDAYKIDAGSGEVHYYKYSADKTGNYDLTVTQAINEDYYISMFVPKSEDYGNELYFYSIVGPSELSGVKAAKVNKINSFNVLVADLYTQETSSLVVSPDDQQISASNKLLAVKASTSITINNAYARAHLSGTELFHSFNLSLDRYTEAGVSSDIEGLEKSGITAKYSIGAEANAGSTAVTDIDLQSNYLNIVTTEIMAELLQASEKGTPFVISAYIEMDFDENKLEAEFPQKSSDSNIGVNVAATSNLSYDETRLAYTSMTEAFAPDNHYYYRESVNSAILYYSAVSETDEYESYGKLSQNQSRLGVNGYCSDLLKMPINTEALYNVSAISPDDLARAETLRLTIMLSKKTDMYDETGAIVGVEYSQVNDLRDYLNEDITVTSGTLYSQTHRISDQSPGKLVVDIPIASCEGESDIYNFGVGFQAITGEGFTEYANYRVTVRAELLKEDGSTIDNSGASDYIVYTNAKVYPEVMSEVN